MKKEEDMDSKTIREIWETMDLIDDSHMPSREEMDKLEADPEFQKLEKRVNEALKKAGLL